MSDDESKSRSKSKSKSRSKSKSKSVYLTSVVPSVMKLVSMEADGTPLTPLPLSVLPFTDI